MKQQHRRATADPIQLRINLGKQFNDFLWPSGLKGTKYRFGSSLYKGALSQSEAGKREKKRNPSEEQWKHWCWPEKTDLYFLREKEQTGELSNIFKIWPLTEDNGSRLLKELLDAKLCMSKHLDWNSFWMTELMVNFIWADLKGQSGQDVDYCLEVAEPHFMLLQMLMHLKMKFI